MDIFARPQYLADAKNRQDAITQESEIAALASTMSFELSSLVSIVWNKSSNQLERDDYYGAGAHMRPACYLFRHYTKEASNKTENEKMPLCWYCDEYHIELLKQKLKSYDQKLKCDGNANQSTRNKYFWSGYREPELQSVCITVYDSEQQLNYIKYKCPMMGYTELLFPVIIEDIYLGCVFIGQNLIKSDKEAETIFSEFIETKYELIGAMKPTQKRRLFKEMITQEDHRVDLLRRVRNTDLLSQDNSDIGDFIKSIRKHDNIIEEDFDAYEQRCINQISWLYSKLLEHLRVKRQKGARRIVSKMTTLIEEKFNSVNATKIREADIREYFEFLNDGEICDDMKELNIRSITILGNQKNRVK